MHQQSLAKDVGTCYDQAFLYFKGEGQQKLYTSSQVVDVWAKLCPPLLQKLKRKIKGIRCALNPVSFSNLFAVVFLLVCLFACFVFVFFRFFHFCLFVCLFFASDSFGSPPLSYFDPSQKLAPNAILSAVFSLLYIMNVSNISIYSLF